MKKFLTVLTILLLTQLSYADEIPKPTGWVNDFGGVIPEEYRGKIARLIGELEQKTSAEVFVVTVNSIAPYDEKSYARMVFDSWRPGKKEKDNGVLVLLAIKERRWRIETGYGVEGILPDGRCGEIGRNYMVPYFKQGEYGKGLYSGVAAISGIISKNAKVKLSGLRGAEAGACSSYSKGKKNEYFTTATCLFFVGLILPPVIGLFFILLACVIIAFGFYMPGMALFFFFIYIVVSIFKFKYWSHLPHSKRGDNFFTYGGSFGGGFGGGGFGGGGFSGGGGGGGGGGGAGGGF